MTQIIFLLLISLFISHSSSRRILHQPFFPVTDTPPPPPPTITQPPSLAPFPPPQLPKYPFSSLSPPSTTTTHHHHHHHHPFFPLYTTPPTTTTTTTTLPTFPANISTITLPSSTNSHHLSKNHLFILSLTLSLISIIFIATVVATLLHRRHHHHKPPTSDSLRLFPANLPTSDKSPPPTLPHNFSTPSSEFLYIGTIKTPPHTTTTTVTATTATVNYDHGASSPELHPLPPLPRQDGLFSEVEGRRSTAAPPPPPPPAPESGFSKVEKKDEILKPKLKGLHWDKVKSRSEKAMVWDQLKCNSFKLNEEMIETLFMAKPSTLAPNHTTKEPMVQPLAAEVTRKNRVLDPHKSRNIAILLRAFNLTIDEVCECILQGNVDSLGSELLGSLLKMAPTMAEEVGLKEMNDALFDPAEKFLKAVIHIPFAFKRVDAMLYISNFDIEVDYLKGSFETIKSACRQLRNSRMFIKLLEAVLIAGNRLNTGTNRGDAHAFKLDTLLKLIDVKGIDGKTTLLHFVVQEIARTEGHVSRANQQSELCVEVESTKRGLEVVSSLSGELSSVKKAATMDFGLLLQEVGMLDTGLTKINEVVALNERFGSNNRFSDSMNAFLKKAGNDIVKIEGEKRVAVSMVKETTEYFHGSLTMEESQPLWIFMVVRDFLLVLDRVSKEVRKINERTIVGSQSVAPIFPRFNGQDFGSFDGKDGSTRPFV
ncbi:hypothetical protein QVD17_35389 [Tagetes erecta]|uniref:Formin-like protein n=1 Tax=Tagetes erecta TaxID=13708 RepID=A0AAD8NMH6_TARER|nr:hypothetical protein QVD17_35389 [Tagetes erecta]